jgi:putative ABC transport system permease protein
MILRIAWKNVWRNPVRSGVVMAAIVVGIWSLMFLLSFFQGMVESYINTAIENKTSHIQLHDKNFVNDLEIQHALTDYEDKQKVLISTGFVESVCPRIIVSGLVASATGNRGALIKAIDPDMESQTTKFQNKVVEGVFLDTEKRNPLLMSKGMGKKLGISINQHVVLSFQDATGEIVSGRFRVVGWYDTRNTKLDDVVVYVRMNDLAPLTGLENRAYHEMAIKLTDINQLEKNQDSLEKMFPDILVRNYKEISPDLALYTGQVKIALTIIIVIIMIALLFGIINTMLMAVLERQKELGMLMAIGMNRYKVFMMVMTETLILCMIAAPAGLLMGHLTISGLSKTGIDMSTWSDALAQFGMAAIVYPTLDFALYGDIVTALIITALIAGIYPAIKAICTSPAKALRKT